MENISFTAPEATSTPRGENKKQMIQPKHSKMAILKLEMPAPGPSLKKPVIRTLSFNKVTKLHHSQGTYSFSNVGEANVVVRNGPLGDELPSTSGQAARKLPQPLTNKFTKLHHSQGTYSNSKNAEVPTTGAQSIKRRKFHLSSNYNQSVETASTSGEANTVTNLFFDNEVPSTSVQASEKHNAYSFQNESAIFSAEALSHEAPLQQFHSQNFLSSGETPDASIVSEPNKEIMDMLRSIEKRLQVLEENSIPQTDVMAHQKLLRESKVLIKSVHKMMCRICGETGSDLHSDLATIMPLQSLDAIIDFEEKLSGTDFKDAVITYLFALKGSSGNLASVVRCVFTDEVMDFFNYGGTNGKRALSELKVVKHALFEIFKLLGKEKFESDFRAYVAQSHSRSKQRRYMNKKNSN